MTAANWTDLLATVRYIVGSILPIVTAVGTVLAGYWAYRSKSVGEANSGHLKQQDRSIAAIDTKVADLVAITPDDHLRARVNNLADDLKAIRREAGPGG